MWLYWEVQRKGSTLREKQRLWAEKSNCCSPSTLAAAPFPCPEGRAQREDGEGPTLTLWGEPLRLSAVLAWETSYPFSLTWARKHLLLISEPRLPGLLPSLMLTCTPNLLDTLNSQTYQPASWFGTSVECPSIFPFYSLSGLTLET